MGRSDRDPGSGRRRRDGSTAIIAMPATSMIAGGPALPRLFGGGAGGAPQEKPACAAQAALRRCGSAPNDVRRRCRSGRLCWRGRRKLNGMLRKHRAPNAGARRLKLAARTSTGGKVRRGSCFWKGRQIEDCDDERASLRAKGEAAKDGAAMGGGSGSVAATGEVRKGRRRGPWAERNSARLHDGACRRHRRAGQVAQVLCDDCVPRRGAVFGAFEAARDIGQRVLDALQAAVEGRLRIIVGFEARDDFFRRAFAAGGLGMVMATSRLRLAPVVSPNFCYAAWRWIACRSFVYAYLMLASVLMPALDCATRSTFRTLRSCVSTRALRV